MTEELPGKPGRRDARCRYVTHQGLVGNEHRDAFLALNLLRDAKFSKAMTYDNAVDALAKAVELAKDDAEKNKRVSPKLWASYGMNKLTDWGREKLVSYLEVEPADYRPIEAKGKDFIVTSKWDGFEQTTRYNDDPHDPSYSRTVAKSKGAARKLYNILHADPTALRTVSEKDFRDWLTKRKIAWEIHNSVWR